MNNTQIIEQAAIDSGFFTQEEVERLTADGKSIPFLTATGWKRKGFVPKEGIKGFETRLWRKRPSRRGSTPSGDESLSGSFYKVRCHLFHPSQVKAIDDVEVTE